MTWSGSDLSGSIDSSRQQSLQAYVERLAKLDGVTDVQSALTPPPGLAALDYAALLSIPSGQRPAQASGLATYLKTWIGEGSEDQPVINNNAFIGSPALNTHLLWNHDLARDWNIEFGGSWLTGKHNNSNALSANLFGTFTSLRNPFAEVGQSRPHSVLGARIEF